MTRRKRRAEGPVRLGDDELDLLRELYEQGLEMPERERARCGLGYKGLARKFAIPKRTVRCYVHYQRRATR